MKKSLLTLVAISGLALSCQSTSAYNPEFTSGLKNHPNINTLIIVEPDQSQYQYDVTVSDLNTNCIKVNFYWNREIYLTVRDTQIDFNYLNSHINSKAVALFTDSRKIVLTVSK